MLAEQIPQHFLGVFVGENYKIGYFNGTYWEYIVHQQIFVYSIFEIVSEFLYIIQPVGFYNIGLYITILPITNFVWSLLMGI